MAQPPGYIHPEYPHHICKLCKALYGLKQASRAWYNELQHFLIAFGFRKSLADAALFIYAKNGLLIYFLVYDDDIVLTGNNSSFLAIFVSQLAIRFSIKDLGFLHHFWGLKLFPLRLACFFLNIAILQTYLTGLTWLELKRLLRQ